MLGDDDNDNDKYNNKGVKADKSRQFDRGPFTIAKLERRMLDGEILDSFSRRVYEDCVREQREIGMPNFHCFLCFLSPPFHFFFAVVLPVHDYQLRTTPMRKPCSTFSAPSRLGGWTFSRLL